MCTYKQWGERSRTIASRRPLAFHTILPLYTKRMSNSQGKLHGETYGQMLRAIRMGKGYTQKRFAEVLGIAPSTVGNMESYSHRVMRRDRLERALRTIDLDAASSERILAAFDEAPESEYAQKRRDYYAKMRTQRRAVKSATTIAAALLRMLELRLLEEASCECSDGFVCELCQGMRALGVDGWQTSAHDDLDRVRVELGLVDDSTGNSHVVDNVDNVVEGDFGG